MDYGLGKVFSGERLFGVENNVTTFLVDNAITPIATKDLDQHGQQGATQGTLRYDPTSTNEPASIAAFPRENTRIGAGDIALSWANLLDLLPARFPKMGRTGNSRPAEH